VIRDLNPINKWYWIYTQKINQTVVIFLDNIITQKNNIIWHTIVQTSKKCETIMSRINSMIFVWFFLYNMTHNTLKYLFCMIFFAK
jgi:hypothetical protein